MRGLHGVIASGFSASGGAGISLVSTATERSTTSSSGRTYTLPSGLQEGDLVIAACATDDALSTGYSAGWTSLHYETAFPNTRYIYKFMTSTPDTTVSFSNQLNSNRTAFIAMAYRGVDAITPFDVTTLTGNSGGAQDSPICPTITTVTDGALVVCIGGLDDDATAVTAVDNSFTDLLWERSNASDTTFNDCTIMSSQKLLSTAGASGETSYTTGSTDAYSWVTLALRPA